MRIFSVRPPRSNWVRTVPLFVLGLLLVALSSPAMAGSNTQSTEFDLAASPAAVCRWIEKHETEIYAAGGAEVLAARGKRLRLRADSEGQVCEFILERTSNGPGAYRGTLVRTIAGPVVAHEATIHVDPGEGGAHVTISCSAEVEGIANAKLAVGLRRCVRGMRQLFSENFREQ